MADKIQSRTLGITADEVQEKRFDTDYYIEGYATTFEPYVLYYDGDTPIYERVMPNAFANADMSDIILRFDHEGRVFARQTNGTLGVEVDSKGFFFYADLSKTELSRQIYEEVKSGMITKMSWAFSFPENKRVYDSSTRTIMIEEVRKVFDVSLVGIPASSNTSVSARSLEECSEAKKFVQSETQRLNDEIARIERKKKQINLMLELGGLNNGH